MTYKERLKIARKDLGDKISELKKDLRTGWSKEKTIETLKALGNHMMTIPGFIVGAVKYAPYCFAIPTFVREGFEKEVPTLDEKEAANAYRTGTYLGGVLSNIAIHGGLIYHTIIKDNILKDNPAYFKIYLATLIGSNLLDDGYEYWRGLGKRVKKQEEEQLTKSEAEASA